MSLLVQRNVHHTNIYLSTCFYILQILVTFDLLILQRYSEPCTMYFTHILYRSQKKNKKIKTMISQLCPHVTKCNCALWRISRSMKHQTLKNWTLTIVYRYCLSRHRRCIRNSRIKAHGLLMLVGTFIPEAFMRKYFCDYPTAIP